MDHVLFFPVSSTGPLHVAEGTVLEDKKQKRKITQWSVHALWKVFPVRYITAIT